MIHLLCFTRNLTKCFLISFSNNLHVIVVKLTGLPFSDLFLGYFLKRGITLASFKLSATIPLLSDKLNIIAKEILIYSTVSTKNVEIIPSMLNWGFV